MLSSYFPCNFTTFEVQCGLVWCGLRVMDQRSSLGTVLWPPTICLRIATLLHCKELKTFCLTQTHRRKIVRRQIRGQTKAKISQIGHCITRYGTCATVVIQSANGSECQPVSNQLQTNIKYQDWAPP